MSVNIEKIMQEIRDEIKEKGYTYDMLSFNEVDAPLCIDNKTASIEGTEKSLVYMDNASSVLAYRPLAGSKLAILVKKVIRKLTKFYVEPIVESQNEFNKATVESVSSVFHLIKQQSSDKIDTIGMNEMREKISTMELQLKTACAEIQTLNEKVIYLETENKKLKNLKAE